MTSPFTDENDALKGTDRLGRKRTRSTWSAMHERCSDPTNPNYHRYGGRGITVCERWARFSNFVTDMGYRPVGYVIDRTDNDGNYEPGNCRWVTPKESSRNTSTRIFIEHNGRRLTVQEWSELLGISTKTIMFRLRQGYPPNDILTTERFHTTNKRYIPQRTTGASSRQLHQSEYHVWKRIRHQCSDPSSRDARYYFDRGIRLCEKWSDFDAFLKDMGFRPSPAHVLRLVDSKLGYQPGNCVWTTKRKGRLDAALAEGK